MRQGVGGGVVLQIPQVSEGVGTPSTLHLALTLPTFACSLPITLGVEEWGGEGGEEPAPQPHPCTLPNTPGEMKGVRRNGHYCRMEG